MTQTEEQCKNVNWELNFAYDASWKVGITGWNVCK